MKKLIFTIVFFITLLSCDNSNEFVPNEIELQKSLYCYQGNLILQRFEYTAFPAYGTDFRTGYYYNWKVRYNFPYISCVPQQQYLVFRVWAPPPGTCPDMPNYIYVNGTKYFPEHENTECTEDAMVINYQIPIYPGEFNNPNHEWTFTISSVSSSLWNCTPVFIAAVYLKYGSFDGGIINIEGSSNYYEPNTYNIVGLLGGGC